MNGHPSADLPSLLRGELLPDEGAEIGRHLTTCEICRTDLIDTAIAIGALEDLRRTEQTSPPQWAAPVAARVPKSPWRWVVAALAGLVLLLGAWNGYLFLHERSAPAAGPAVHLVAEGGSGASGQARMLGSGQSQRMQLTVSGLPPAPSDSYYQVALTGKAGILPVGILEGEGGIYVLPASLVKGYSAIEVRLESKAAQNPVAGQAVLRGNL
jgi:anti-sigma factor RsiW